MKVAVVHGLLRGGAARRMAGTVQALVSQPGVELQVFTLAGSHPIAAPTRTVAWDPLAPSRPRLLRPFWRYVDLLTLRRAWARLWDEVDEWRPDAVFANPCAEPGGAPPWLARSQAPVVYYCDEPRRVDYEVAAARASNPATRVPYAALRRVQRHDERASVAAAAVLLTNSQFTAHRIRKAYGRPATVVTPGIAAAFGSSAEPVRTFFERTHVLSVGTLIPSKGHDLAIEAAALAGTRLPVVIVAPRPDHDERSRLGAVAHRVGVEIDVRTAISDAELVDLYRTAVATLYLAIEEPLGLASLESQACGTPVVVADDGGLVETLADGVSGFAVPRSAAAAAQALAQLLVPARQQEMARAAVARTVPRDGDAAVAVVAALSEASGSARAVEGG